ncbi:MAG TPA: hypothetical protein VK934_02645 [Fimbriimonas sp.]|nr:hypothetical protein [Fimbriimonas sp.]
MKRFALLVAAIVSASCAKFPDTGPGSQFTRVTFRMKVAGKINTAQDDDFPYYVYDIAIRATPEINPEDRFAPVPVVAEGSPNGRMAGSPTHFVEFDTLNPQSADPFVLYRFATQAEVPNPSDPTNPINLNSYTRSTRGRIVNFQDLDADPSVLQFDIFVNQLADTDDASKLLNSLQVNFLTMSRTALGGGTGTRAIDSIGDNRVPSDFNRYIRVDLRQDGVTNNTTGITTNIEPSGDVYPNGITDPDLDIIDWSIEVRRNG